MKGMIILDIFGYWLHQAMGLHLEEEEERERIRRRRQKIGCDNHRTDLNNEKRCNDE